MKPMTAAAPPPFDRRAIPAGFAFGQWRAPDGWIHRRYDWPAEGIPRGSVLFLGGRADFIEKYLEAVSELRARGWNIAGFDWRGQGGSGRIVEGLEAGHLASFDPLIDDLAVFTAQWMAATLGPHVLIGHSMGGHLVLRALAERRVTPDAAVLTAPMLGLTAPRIGRLAAFLAGLLGRTLAPIWGHVDHSLRQRSLTGSVERFEDAGWWKREQPALGLGVPTWGWVHAAFDSIARLDRPGVLEAVTVPVLIVAARTDRLVSGAATRAAARRLPHAELVITDGAHELLREADPVRHAVLAAIDRFLDEAAPRG